jgi:hypothetical protein
MVDVEGKDTHMVMVVMKGMVHQVESVDRQDNQRMDLVIVTLNLDIIGRR